MSSEKFLRFTSLSHAPSETRRLLRDRFSRFLPSQHSSSVPPITQNVLPDELMLRLLSNLRVAFNNELEKAKNLYGDELLKHDGGLSFDELISGGWIRVVWGRVLAPFAISRTASSEPAGTMTAFLALLDKLYDQTYYLTDLVKRDKDLGKICSAIERGELKPYQIVCQSPEWVAARLWDGFLSDGTDHSEALRIWIDLWDLLGHPMLIPNKIWNETAAKAFRDAVIGVLDSDPSLLGWDKIRSMYIKQMALVSRQPESVIEKNIPPVPAMIIDRSLWLEDFRVTNIVNEAFHAFEDFFGLLHLLLADVKHEDNASVPHKIACKLFEMAVKRPVLFFIVHSEIRSSPIFLADLVLYPNTSSLACLLIAQRSPPPNAWDRERTIQDDLMVKTIAFSDAVSILGYFLGQGSVDPMEIASLLVWFHKSARQNFNDFGNRETLLTVLRDEIVRQSTEVLQVMIKGLTQSLTDQGFESSIFASVLDILDTGTLSEKIDPIDLVSAYIGSIEAADFNLSMHRVTVSGAASLFKLVERAPLDLRKRFLRPIDIRARLEDRSEENPLILEQNIALPIRAHIRMLCRAVAGLEGVPEDLASSLIATVRDGAFAHKEKGRIAAFSSGYEAGPLQKDLDRPIAADLGAALNALVDDQRSRLLKVVLEIDEPMVLAQLLSFAPHEVQEEIKNHITNLTPSNAGEIHSLTEVQARIEALLSAGLAEAAGKFIDQERDLKTLGPVPGREMVQFRAKLRLWLLREEWHEIENASPPSSLSHRDKTSIEETIAFFKALAALRNPQGDRNAAEGIFAQLQSRHPDVPAYVINLFATRISILLGDDSFGQLQGEKLAHGRQMLLDAEQMMLQAKAVNDSDTEIFICNKALLLLALRKPDHVIELLTSLAVIRLHDTIAAYMAVAFSRTGRVPEANGILDREIQAHGEKIILIAAREHIRSRASFSAPANSTSNDDPIPRIKLALGDFARMNPIQQAEVFHLPPDPFDEFVIDHVRSASASLTSLVPMMRNVEIDSCEDDLNAVIRELLRSRLQFFLWTVADQSKGGFTAKGNPGERDLIIQKDSTTLAVIEAVVCNETLDRKNLTEHFQRLFAYSNCNLFFHLTYAYLNDSTELCEYLKKTSEQDAPRGFEYFGRQEISTRDSRPQGFIAQYIVESNEVKVVFLVLDMKQYNQRQAAITSVAGKGASN